MELPQHRPAPPSPPAPAPISLKPPAETDLKRRPILPISFSNGALKKHRPIFPPHQGIYRECMKNHAAAMGGHALDGCGEFMASPSSTTSDPSSLLCAACGCHRNFHRRVFSGDNLLHYHPHREEREVDEQDDEGDEAVDDDEDGHITPPQQFYSAPHMLMALSAGISGGGIGSSSSLPGGHRKRFRTKFSAEQKEKMQELSEKLGWRMQKRDDAMVEQCCREIGVSRGVFKVWMHNNKHNFVGGPSSRRSAGAAAEQGTSSGGAAASQLPGGINSGADRPIDSPSPSSEEP